MEILILLLLIILNGVFAMSELAIVSARKARLQSLADIGNVNAKTALLLAENPDDFLSTVQIGITLIGTVAGAFGGATVAENLSNQFGIDKSLSVAIVILITTYLSLVVGELVPKTLALQDPERIALRVARPMRLLSSITAPLVFVLSQSTTLVTRMIGVRDEGNRAINEAEVLSLIREGISEGVFEEDEDDMVENIFRMDIQRITQVMTPRTEIIWLNVYDTLDELREKIGAHPHSAYPVAESTIDNVLGYVRVVDLFSVLLRTGELDLKNNLRKVLLLPESTSVSGLVAQLRLNDASLALILDEFGGIEGMVTIHDIVENIVGQIGNKEPEAIQRADKSWLLDGMLALHRLEDIFPSITFPEEEMGEYETLAGFVMKRLGKIPQTSDFFDWYQLRFEVVDMDGNRIDKVLVQKIRDE